MEYILIRVYNYQYIPRSHCIINLSTMVKNDDQGDHECRGQQHQPGAREAAGKAVDF